MTATENTYPVLSSRWFVPTVLDANPETFTYTATATAVHYLVLDSFYSGGDYFTLDFSVN